MAAWRTFLVVALSVSIGGAWAPLAYADTPIRTCAGLAMLTFNPALGVADQEGNLTVSPFQDSEFMECLDGAVPCQDPEPLNCVPRFSTPNPNLELRYSGNCARATLFGLTGIVVGGSVLSATAFVTTPEGPLLVGLTGSLLAEGGNPCSMGQAMCVCLAMALGQTPG